MNINNANIALVHDWYLRKSIGGAEKVTFIIDELFINAINIPLYKLIIIYKHIYWYG